MTDVADLPCMPVISALFVQACLSGFSGKTSKVLWCNMGPDLRPQTDIGLAALAGACIILYGTPWTDCYNGLSQTLA